MNGRLQPGTPGVTSPAPDKGLPVYKIDLPGDASRDEQFGGCRSVDRYDRLHQIGEGTYGQVFLAKDRDTGELVALKKIRMDNEKEGFPITAIREIKLLKVLDHENVIRLKEIVRSQSHQINQMKGSIYMVFDYMDHDLTGLLERKNYKLSLPQVKCYMYQLLKGLHYCHKQGVLHRDLKAANLLINNNGELKLADFGLARPYMDDDKRQFTARVITLWYRPLELMLGKTDYGPEVDMWSVGCILAELLIGKALFTGKDEPEQIDKIMRLCGSPVEANMPGCSRLPYFYMAKQGHTNVLRKHLTAQQVSAAGIDLLCKLLVLDPAKRLSALDAFKHEFFWSEKPDMCKPEDLPKYEASHEMDMKKRKRSANEKAMAAQTLGGGAVRGAHPMHAAAAGAAGLPEAKRGRYPVPVPPQAQAPAVMHHPQPVPYNANAAYRAQQMGPPPRQPQQPQRSALPPPQPLAPPSHAPHPHQHGAPVNARAYDGGAYHQGYARQQQYPSSSGGGYGSGYDGGQYASYGNYRGAPPAYGQPPPGDYPPGRDMRGGYGGAPPPHTGSRGYGYGGGYPGSYPPDSYSDPRRMGGYPAGPGGPLPPGGRPAPGYQQHQRRQ